MEILNKYWDALSQQERAKLAKSCDLSVDYLRQVFKNGKQISGQAALKIEELTNGYLPRQIFRPDLYPAGIFGGVKEIDAPFFENDDDDDYSAEGD